MSDPDDEPEVEIAAPTQTRTTDVATPKGLGKQQREQYLRDRERRDFWQQVFDSAIGRREMWTILAEAHPFEVRFGVGPNGFPNEQASFMHLGEQQLGLRLYLTWQGAAPDGVRLMLEENDQRFQTPTTKTTRTRKP